TSSPDVLPRTLARTEACPNVTRERAATRVVTNQNGAAHGHGNTAGACRSPPDRGRDAGILPRLLDERDRAARASGRARRAQARAPSHPVRDAAGGPRAQPTVQEERYGRW